MKHLLLTTLILALCSCKNNQSIQTNQEVVESKSSENIVTIHAPVEESYTCSEHWAGQFHYLGDALGTDCVIQELIENDNRAFMKSFKNLGLENKDWYGFGKKVLSPCECEIVKVHKNAVVNNPGVMQAGRAGSITFSMSDGTKVLIAHVDHIKVTAGDIVNRGDVVALVGNNGYSRNPHLHIAAWKGETPLQIRFDQETVGLKMRRMMKANNSE